MAAIASISRATRIAGVVAGVLLSIPPAIAGNDFRELVIGLDHAVDAAPLAIRLADGAGLVAVGQRGDGWRFSVVSLPSGDIVLSGAVPDTVFFYTAGDLLGDGSDELCFLGRRGISALDPATGQLSDVLSFDSIYHGRLTQGPGKSDFVRDIDGDGADDILVPQFDGWLLARRIGDDFERFLLEIPPRVDVDETRVSYQPREPRTGDVDGDGRNDVVFLLDTQFVSFVQHPPGRFPTPGRRDRIDAPLATEKQLAQWERDDGQVDQSDLEIEEVELVRDFDGDGILDLLTDKSIAEGVFDRRSEYHLYLGRRERDSLRYSSSADGRIVSKGVQFDPLVVDVDGDGRLDIATPSTRLGLGRVVSALFSGRISVDLDIYRLRDGGSFADQPDYRTRFKVEFDLETGLMSYPAVAVADFDGDGPAELLVQQKPDELTIFPGVAGAAIFGDDERVISLPLPRNGQMVEARDLDGDGRSDLMVRYGPADGERAGELRVLLSVPTP